MAKQQATQKSQSKKAQTEDPFISDEVSAGGSSSFMKIQKGENKLRIISKPIEGWVEWIDKVAYRTTLDEQPETKDEENPPKKFLALVVIDREDEQVKIWEVTQKSIIKAIKTLAANPDWGTPFSYDLNINKTGEDLKTKYTVTPSPKKPLSKEAIASAKAKPCNLLAIYEGESPWDESDEHTPYVLDAK